MKIVITGATSFIGKSLTDLAIECGNEVFAVCRDIKKANKLFKPDKNLKIIELTLERYNDLPDNIHTADIFIHLAWAGTSVNEREIHEIHQKNIVYTKVAMFAAKQLGCTLFVDSGSQAEYGIYNGKINEDTPCNPISEYGKAKLAVFNFGKEYCSKVGLKYLHLRVFSVFGEMDHPHTLIMTAIKKFMANEPLQLTSCTQKWNFLYIRDAVKQIYALCQNVYYDPAFTYGVYNIASKDTRTLKDFVYRMKELSESQSVLEFGEIKSPNTVTLDPDVSKTFNRIGFISAYTFDEAFKFVMDRLKIKEMQNTNKCIVCGSQLPPPMLKFHNMPASAQDIPTSEELGNDTGIDLRLCQCGHCGLVQLDGSPVSYYKTVIRAGGISSTMRELRLKQYKSFYEDFGLQGKKIIEVGCGRGEFLRLWNDFNVRAVGIENGTDLVEQARRDGLEVYKAFAEDGNTELPEAPFDAFVQFNFLEHQPHPNEMLQCIYNNTTENAVGMVTVPSLEYILKYCGYYELIRDHIAYYSKETLRFLFEKNGFEVLKCETINRDTHSIIVRKRHKIDVSAWKENFDTLHKELDGMLDKYISKGGKVAVWGASHQGFTLLSSMDISAKISYIIDSAPFKQGKFAPASHIPIVSKERFHEEKVDAILIVAPGYTDEISNIIKTELSSDVDIYTLRSNHLEKIS